MTGSPGEMPFLDHLEELRWRILRSLGALVVGFGDRPLAGPAVPARQSPQAADRAVPHRRRWEADRHQPHRAGDDRLQARASSSAWCSPRPSSSGSSGPSSRRRCTRGRSGRWCPRCSSACCCSWPARPLAYVFVVPQALRVLFSFQTEAIQPFITYDNYFGFVLQVVLALGISFELPLVIIILAVARGDRAGRAGPVPPLRGGARPSRPARSSRRAPICSRWS